ncbi:PREDICTED: reticulon-like protein B12 [Nicotiana attenuata]|uniref:Reticulon-like protein n=1 Tax=Nicotiana attenuata TaxID=49451 RepID=A0A1J6IQG0_NICAT|nr:PREDICTED: reticulon-like protein B12 [Nicotiana attenuata]OIT01067.1 reticulon-like protein b12 [Nicotiana attenuata]
MGSNDRLFNRQRSLHQILGGGFVADVVLWRRKDVTVGILVITLFAWVVFEISGYTLLSLVSSVFLLLFTILFLWAKSAAILNRPAPPLPHLYLSEEMVNEAACFVRNHINMLLSASEDIALGKDTNMFVKVSVGLVLVSVIGGLTDFLTLGYTSIVIVLTVPALYEKYEDQVDACILIAYRKLRHFYYKFDAVCVSKVQRLILEKEKLS